MALESRLGDMLFKDFLALHFWQTRPVEDGRDHPLYRFGRARDRAGPRAR